METDAVLFLRSLVRRVVFLLIVLGSTTVFAGPPFRTDDPEPVPWHHYEAYLFSTVDRGLGVSSWALPAVEFNMGAAPNLQLHVVIPGAYLTPHGAYGIGDVELGAKRCKTIGLQLLLLSVPLCCAIPELPEAAVTAKRPRPGSWSQTKMDTRWLPIKLGDWKSALHESTPSVQKSRPAITRSRTA